MSAGRLVHMCEYAVLLLLPVAWRGKWVQGGGCQSSWVDLAQLLICLLFQLRALSICLLMLVASERKDVLDSAACYSGAAESSGWPSAGSQPG